MKYGYNTLVGNLPTKVKNNIYNYMKAGWDMYESGTGQNSLDRITKKELLENYTISDIEEQYPVDELLNELNK